MTWREALRRRLRQCSGCFEWFPLAELTEHTYTYGSKAETERVSRWWSCGDCETRDAGSETPPAG